MAVKLNKPIRRQVAARVTQRPLIITVYPNGVIGLRLKRQRTEYKLLGEDLYWQCARAAVTEALANRKKRKKMGNKSR